MRTTSRTIVAVLFALSSGQLLAQATTESGEAAGDAAGELEEVIVTAQRRTESLQDAAIAISAFQGENILDLGITEAGRLGELAPALTVEKTSTGNVIFMRGVGNFTFTANSDPAIAFNYDGVYVGRPTATVGVFFDLSRIEVLKGPQGTLYGRNATGGAINVLPNEPIIGESTGYGSLSYGNYNAIVTEAGINVPLGENTAMRISGLIDNHDGYLDDGMDDADIKSLRAQLKSNITDRLSIRVAGDYSKLGGNGNGVNYVGRYVYNPLAGGYVFVPSGFSDDEGIRTPASQAYRTTALVQPAGRVLDPLTPAAFVDNEFYGLNAEINFETDAGTLTVVPAWRNSDLNYLGDAASFLFRMYEEDEQFSLEARFNGSRIGILDYIVGAYYFDESSDINNALTLSANAALLEEHYNVESWAPFARLTAHVSDRLRLVGGARYTEDKKDYTRFAQGGTIVCVIPTPVGPRCPNAPLFPLVDPLGGPFHTQLPFPFPPPGPPRPIGTTGALGVPTFSNWANDLSNSKTTWRAAVEYDLSDEALLYFSVETGFRAGGFSSAVGFETYDPEEITAYTIGSKNRFLDNRLQLNVEAFYWDYSDQQVSHVGLDSAGGNAQFIENIGKSTIKGVEVEGQFLAGDNTLISGTVLYLDATNDEFIYQQGVGAPGSPPPLTGCNYSIAANPALWDIDCSGLPGFHSPEWTLNLAIEHTIPLDSNQIVLFANTQYKTDRYVGFNYLNEMRTGDTTMTNAQIEYGPSDGRWSLAAFIRNIEDDRIPVFSSPHPFANLLAEGTTAPRLYGLRFVYRY